MALVIDANVVGKLFLNEPDRADAVALFSAAARQQVKIYAPTFLAFEVYALGIHFGLDVTLPRDTLHKLTEASLVLLEPNDELWEEAYKIARLGHPKSGYPTLEDSLYHALAVKIDGTLITADKRHIAKTKQLGHVAALADWPEYEF